MPTVMNMPKMGVNMTDATIVEWVVKEGDTIKEGDHILDAETDKAVQEIYATASGVLVKILEQAGSVVLCQSPIAVLMQPGEASETEGERPAEPAVAESGKEEEPAPPEPVRPLQADEPITEVNTDLGRIRISPLAKKLAKDLGIAVEQLRPAKPQARIVKADVLAYTSAKSPQSTDAPVASQSSSSDSLPYTGIRKRIGDRMTESWQTKPAVALTLHANAARLVEWRDSLKKAGKAAGYNDMMVMIAAKALLEQPMLNSRLEGGQVQILHDVHVGVAVDTEKGLVVPVIRNADQKSLQEIASDLRSKVDAIKSGKAAAEDLTGGTFTITNLGMYEIEHFSPIINPPECCILALGAIVREPVVDENDAIVVQSRMQMTLVFDHRIVDGAPAAKFLQRVKHLVECPMELLS
jgi:pyruvate dehydrogenase E2 component (dihydrolipoamide acetyltransferase)